MTDAFKGGLTLNLGSSGSPTTYSELCEAVEIGGFGKTNSLIDVTSFCSPGNDREYIAGLADGEEVTLNLNYITNNANQQSVRTSVDNGETRDFQIVMDDGTNSETFTFAAVCLAWTLNPSFDDANRVAFTLKITGGILIT